MATAMDENYSRENVLNDSSTGIVLTSSTSKKSNFDEVPDYNEAFPQLISAGHMTNNRSNTFFSSPFPLSSNGNNSQGAMANTTTSLYSSTKNDEDRRRKLAIHASSATTKIIEIPPDERVLDKLDNSRRGGNQSSRNTGANNSGQTIQKLCLRIQKETSTNITFFYKDQTLIVTITGRPEQVRSAQVQILREIQKPVNLSVNIPWDFHRYIIGVRGATLKTLEQETLTRITVPPQESHSNSILVTGAKDNVKLCEQRILELYHTQLNKGFERLSIPFLYHPWIRYQLVDDLHQQLNVTIDVPPPVKQTDEITIKGEREPVEQAKTKILEFYKKLEGKIMTFPLEIPCEQHRFILGKKGAGLKEIFDKTNVIVRIPNQEENSPTIQIMGETGKIGEAITMIYKMANSLMAVQIAAPRWMHGAVRGERNSHLENFRKTYPDVRIYFRDDSIALEGPPEDVERVRSQIQTAIDELKSKNTTYLEVDIDPKHYKQLIGKNQTRLLEMQEQTGCDIKFPYENEGNLVKLMGTKENVEKARQLLVERTTKLENELRTDLSIDPQYYPQIIGAKGKNLEEIRSKFHNIQITFPEANGKSDKVTLHGNKDDVEKCSKFLQQKVKDLYSTEIDVPKRVFPLLIGKGGSNIKVFREKVPDVRIDVPSLEDNKDSTHIRLSGKKVDVDKARKLLEEHINQLNTSIENSIEQYITIDPKWHSRFFLNKRKLLTDLQQQYGDMLIKIPERNANSDQVLLRGPKETVEQVRKHLEELIDTWENTITKEINIPHRHHGYLLAQGGAYIQPIQKEYNVQIKFPPRANTQKDEQESTAAAAATTAAATTATTTTAAATTAAATTTAPNEDENQKDIVRITGRNDDIDKAIVALEKMIPVETTVDIPSDAHGSLVGKGGSNLQSLIKQYPDVQITFPPQNSSQNTIQLKGQSEQVESVRKQLLESYEKLQADRQARSFEVRFTIKPEYRSLVFGFRGKTLSNLRQKYDVKIDISNNNQTVSSAVVPAQQTTSSSSNDNDNQTDEHDDQQATPQENLPLPSETSNTNQLSDIEIVITGYEDKALSCRDEILQLIKEFESKITMEIEIDPRIHARIIGSGGSKLQQIMKEFNVEIKFQANNQADKVHVIGLDQDKIDACIDHLLILEEDYLQDLPYRPLTTTQNSTELTLGQQLSNTQEVPTNNNNNNPNTKSNRNDNKNKQGRQAPFQVKNAPWTNGNEYENEYQQKNSLRKSNGHDNSPKKSTTIVPNPDDLLEYPSFSNGISLTTNDGSSQVHQTTVNPIPVIWGPQKRNK
jgi:transcription antitermination factor NusA-like protein